MRQIPLFAHTKHHTHTFRDQLEYFWKSSHQVSFAPTLHGKCRKWTWFLLPHKTQRSASSWTLNEIMNLPRAFSVAWMSWACAQITEDSHWISAFLFTRHLHNPPAENSKLYRDYGISNSIFRKTKLFAQMWFAARWKSILLALVWVNWRRKVENIFSVKFGWVCGLFGVNNGIYIFECPMTGSEKGTWIGPVILSVKTCTALPSIDELGNVFVFSSVPRVRV